MKSLKELMLNEGIFDEEPKRMTEDEQNELLGSIREYNKFGKTIYREGNLIEIAKKINRIAEYAERFITESNDDWFDNVTVKRNMKELRGVADAFYKVAKEQQQSQDRLAALYEDAGRVLDRYFEIEDLHEEDPYPERNGLKPGDRVNVDMTAARKYDPRPHAVRKLKDQLKMGKGTVKVNRFEGKLAYVSGGDIAVMNEIKLPVDALLIIEDRKPKTFSSVKDKISRRKLPKNLKTYTAKELYGNNSNPEPTSDDFVKTPKETEFVLDLGVGMNGGSFYVDTQGYNYARYVTRIVP